MSVAEVSPKTSPHHSLAWSSSKDTPAASLLHVDTVTRDLIQLSREEAGPQRG